ncbi:MAG: hypothetical protein HYW24_04515 [Candidatus Aenigmarchaeota archaeon]|nr:hypothetical protein [Candidatus Aenigmarchaeota archaeon]
MIARFLLSSFLISLLIFQITLAYATSDVSHNASEILAGTFGSANVYQIGDTSDRMLLQLYLRSDPYSPLVYSINKNVSGTGLYGKAEGSGGVGVYGVHSSSGVGVQGQSLGSGTGVFGYSLLGGSGVYGQAAGSTGIGVRASGSKYDFYADSGNPSYFSGLVNITARSASTGLYVKSGDLTIRMENDTPFSSTQFAMSAGKSFWSLGTGYPAGNAYGLDDKTFFIWGPGASGGGMKLVIDPSGNVGINTTSPQSALHVKGAGNSIITIENSTTIGNPNINLKSGLTDWYLGTGNRLLDSGKALYILGSNSSGSTKLVIDSSGRVAIGTMYPKYMFLVADSAESELFRTRQVAGIHAIPETGESVQTSDIPAGDLMSFGGGTKYFFNIFAYDPTPPALTTADERNYAVVGMAKQISPTQVNASNSSLRGFRTGVVGGLYTSDESTWIAGGALGTQGIVNWQNNQEISGVLGIINAGPGQCPPGFRCYSGQFGSRDGAYPFVVTSGNVGIGTTDPKTQLQVTSPTNNVGGTGLMTESWTKQFASNDNNKNLFLVSNTHGAQSFMVTVTVGEPSFSVSKTYIVSHKYGGSPVVNTLTDTGAFGCASGQTCDFSLTFSNADGDKGTLAKYTITDKRSNNPGGSLRISLIMFNTFDNAFTFTKY